MKQFYMSKKFWKEIRTIIPQKKNVRRRRKSAKKIMNALYYILRTGIQWKALPKEFEVSASTVHRRYQEWIKHGVFYKFWQKLLKKYQKNNHSMMRWVAIDGSFSKAPLGGEKVGKSPVDRRKIGTKKHIIVDQNGIILSIVVSGANRHDNIFVKEAFDGMPIKLQYDKVIAAADTAYDAKNTRTFLKKRNFIPLIPTNPRKSKSKPALTRSRHRWIVERTHGHLNKWRGIFVRWNKKFENYVAAIQIAASNLVLGYL